MRHHLQTAVAFFAVASAIFLLAYTAVVPRPLTAQTGEIPTYTEAS